MLTRITFDILRFLKNQELHPKKELYIDSNFILSIQRSYVSIRQIGFHIIFSHNEDVNSSLKLISTHVIFVRGHISKSTKEKRIYFFPSRSPMVVAASSSRVSLWGPEST